MVQIAVSRRRELERAEADVVESFVVDAVCLIGVLDELMNGQCGVVWLHNGIRDLQRHVHN